jgi:predicted solute-binding protein
MLDAADAALVIGDVALYLEGQPDLGRLDLGQAWTASTGLPFVYAFWAGRPGVATRADAGALRAALRAGLEAVPQIAAAYGARGDSSDAARRALNEEYLRSHIVYTLRDPERRGLREFYRLAHLHGLIPRVPELRFHDDP